MYVCDAGSTYNRFESDFNKWNYTLTCLENNVFTEEPSVPWPTCVDSEYYTKKNNFDLHDLFCSNSVSKSNVFRNPRNSTYQHYIK